MTTVVALLLLLAQVAPMSLDQIRGEANLERRAKLAVEFAAAAEKTAELKSMLAAVETAREALEATGRPASKHPGPYKTAELKTQEILKRLNDLDRRMDSEERAMLEGPRARIQEIHDAWFDGIMSKKK
jgi:hypothetical protein